MCNLIAASLQDMVAWLSPETWQSEVEGRGRDSLGGQEEIGVLKCMMNTAKILSNLKYLMQNAI